VHGGADGKFNLNDVSEISKHQSKEKQKLTIVLLKQ